MGRTLGIILIIGGLVGLLLVAVLMAVYWGEGGLSGGAATLGFTLFAIIPLLLVGGGVFLFWQGGQEAAAMGQVKQQRLLLNIVKTQGQVAISDLVLEMNSSRDAVQQMLYDLVGKGLFSGYVVWDEGMLYSREASQLRDMTQCQNCGGQLELGGKGVVRCPFCGTEYFLD